MMLLVRFDEGGAAGGRGLEEAVQASGEVPFEAASDLLVAFCLRLFVGRRSVWFWVVAEAGERDRVEGAIELAVAAAVEPVADCLAGGGSVRCGAGQGSEGGFGAEAARV